jgi:hypothetical protein
MECAISTGLKAMNAARSKPKFATVEAVTRHVEVFAANKVRETLRVSPESEGRQPDEFGRVFDGKMFGAHRRQNIAWRVPTPMKLATPGTEPMPHARVSSPRVSTMLTMMMRARINGRR